VREDQLTDALWPEAEGDMAHWSFKTTLRRLRQLISNENAILHQDGKVSLDPRYCWVDVWAFERMVEQVDSLNVQARAGNEEGHFLDKTLSLYRGHFLEEENEKLWAIRLRECLKAKFLDVLDKIGSHWERQGDFKKAISCYRKGLEVDDLAEGLYQHQMRCFDKLGRKAEALEVYERCRSTLSAVFGIEPSPETEKIRRSILSE
jgi:DNA-binding SARP family transcriptional activator